MPEKTKRKRPQNKKVGAPKNNRVASGTKRPKTVKARKLSPVLRLITVLTVLMLICCMGFYIKNEVVVLGARNSMATYLKNKYGKDFKVERPSLNNGGFGVSGTWSADAYPADNKEDKFSVMKSEKRDSFADQYTALIWSQRETKRINELVQKNATGWEASATVTILLSQPLSNDVLPDDSNIEEVIGQDHGLSYTVKIRYSEVDRSAMDLVVRNLEQVTNTIRKRVHNIDIDYYIETKHGEVKKCLTTYDKPFDYSYNNIKSCLN